MLIDDDDNEFFNQRFMKQFAAWVGQSATSVTSRAFHYREFFITNLKEGLSSFFSGIKMVISTCCFKQGCSEKKISEKSSAQNYTGSQ